MRVAIRTDASLAIGTGHVMRCLTLAGELRARGAAVSFICREHPGHLCERIAAQGMPVYRLPAPAAAPAPDSGPPHAHWLGVAWERDADETRAALAAEPWDWLIADHYALDARWERALRGNFGKLMVIDDLADREHDCHVLLDQNLLDGLQTRYDALVPPDCLCLFGPRHALLRPEFVAARRLLGPRDGTVRRILVNFGGIDPSDQTGKTLEALLPWQRAQLTLDVIAGAQHPFPERLRQLCARFAQAELHAIVDHMAQHMTAAQLAVGASGSTTWERLALGLPAITLSVADNQEPIGRAVHVAGAALHLGPADGVTTEALGSAITTLLDDPARTRAMGERGMTLVDGMGAMRVVDGLCGG